jgi:hypothetical protein
MKPPRAVFVPFIMGHQFGPPFHAAAQRRIITDALDLIKTATENPTILDLPITWVEVRKEATQLEKEDA